MFIKIVFLLRQSKLRAKSDIVIKIKIEMVLSFLGGQLLYILECNKRLFITK